MSDEDATRKLLPWNLSYSQYAVRYTISNSQTFVGLFSVCSQSLCAGQPAERRADVLLVSVWHSGHSAQLRARIVVIKVFK